jgi:hypothetical protein
MERSVVESDCTGRGQVAARHRHLHRGPEVRKVCAAAGVLAVNLCALRLSLCVVALVVAGAAGAAGDATGSATPAPEPADFARGLIELKRQSTARGTPDETTKTNLKFDFFPSHGAVALLRLELPFPDEKTTFTGSAFDPEFGDAKVRVGFRAMEIGARPVTSFVELTFPTADPPPQGSGKYEFSAGAKPTFALPAGPPSIGSPGQSLSVQAQQVFSFAGDPARKDINQTKFELEWRGTWPSGQYAKATAKPVIDWVGDGQTGAVLELEYGLPIDPQWSLAFMAGGLLWGQGVPSTYSRRAEIKLVYRY